VPDSVTARIERIQNMGTLEALMGRAAVAGRLEEIERMLADVSEQ
jgi:hypothetical protein